LFVFLLFKFCAYLILIKSAIFTGSMVESVMRDSVAELSKADDLPGSYSATASPPGSYSAACSPPASLGLVASPLKSKSLDKAPGSIGVPCHCGDIDYDYDYRMMIVVIK
jgi:hypothetical protein